VLTSTIATGDHDKSRRSIHETSRPDEHFPPSLRSLSTCLKHGYFLAAGPAYANHPGLLEALFLMVRFRT
jgi:hypothetical protein